MVQRLFSNSTRKSRPGLSTLFPSIPSTLLIVSLCCVCLSGLPLIIADSSSTPASSLLPPSSAPSSSFPCSDNLCVSGQPYQFFAGQGDVHQQYAYNAEAHQHPWLATAVSIGILLLLIMAVLCLATSGRKTEAVRRLELRGWDVGPSPLGGGDADSGGMHPYSAFLNEDSGRVQQLLLRGSRGKVWREEDEAAKQNLQ
jgi:hypothetical protein